MKMKKKVVKEGYYKGELINNSLDAVQKAKALLVGAANDVRKATGESFLFARLDSHVNDLDDTIDDLTNSLAEMDDGEYQTSVSESSVKPWFDEKYGWLQRRIPKECVDDCSGPGRKDDAVEYWVDKLKFYIPENLIEKAMDYLREFGAWDEFELQEWADTEDVEHQLAQHVLWCFCCDLYEGNVKQGELYLGH